MLPKRSSTDYQNSVSCKNKIKSVLIIIKIKFLAFNLFFQISADSQEEEFHENLIYGSGLFRKQSTGDDADSGLMSMVETKPIPATKVQSPFASSDSLNTRDHSDGIWNESQTTVRNI